MHQIRDPFGQAVYDYFHHKKTGRLVVMADDFDEDEIPVAYLFRSFDEMPELEKTALKACKGNVLDIGAGAGCHALWLQKNGLQVTALEQSMLCAQVMKERGIATVVHQDFYRHQQAKYDTLLLLMNGTGIAGTLEKFPVFLSKLKELLSPGGQILIDSSDLIYLYEEEDGTANLPLNASYYGELTYKFKYKNHLSEAFPWLFLDQHLFAAYAEKAGLRFEILARGENYDYLARLVVNTF